jgi:Mg2+ and Co2+ transporter CorA
MQGTCEWVDLLDPTEAELRQAWPTDLHPQAIETLLQPHTHADEPRPKFETHGKYALAVLLLPVVVAEEDRVYYREVDILMAHDHVLTVRKTPPDGTPFDLAEVQAMCQTGVPAGMVAYHIVDEVAEGFLDKIRRRLSDLRHDLLHIRRTLAPTRDAVRRVIDNRVEIDDDEELFPHDVELHFGDAYDKLLRSSEGLETARDLIGGVRDYHQSKVANDQNEVMKRLTLVASIFLPPTFIVGLYGQNFDWIPELHWAQGYGFSWLLIMISTIGQLIYFRRRGYL